MASGRHLLVVGSINIDGTLSNFRAGSSCLAHALIRLLNGNQNASSIVATGETIASTSYSRAAGGKGANQAVAAAKAGAVVKFMGAIGRDGEWLRDELLQHGVDIQHLHTDEKRPTGRAIIQLSTSTKDNAIVLLPGANFSPAFGTATSISELSTCDSSTCSHVLLQNEILYETTLRYLEQETSDVIYNPSPMFTKEGIDQLPWHRVRWLIVNEGEARQLLEALSHDGISEGTGLIDQLLRTGRFNGENGLIMTKGAEGVEFGYLGVIGSVKSEPVEKVVDTTGAGDCFTGYFAHLISQDQERNLTTSRTPLEEIEALKIILRQCNRAAGICVTGNGAMDSMPRGVDVFGGGN